MNQNVPRVVVTVQMLDQGWLSAVTSACSLLREPGAAVDAYQAIDLADVIAALPVRQRVVGRYWGRARLNGMKPLTRAECQAARIVAAHTDCLYEQLDPGGGSRQLPDFELRDARQHRIGVLEVTSTAAEDYRRFESARLKHDISDPRLRFAWFIEMKSASISVKELAKALPALLVQAESKGLTPKLPFVLIPDFSYLAGEEPYTSLANLGVCMFSAFPAPNRAGRVNVKPPAQGGSFGPELVTEVIQRELELEDNLAKLQTAAVRERAELFVWLEFDQAGMALVIPRITPGLGLPRDGPALPRGITKVWAATGPDDADVLARALWVAEGGIWNVIPSPPRLS